MLHGHKRSCTERMFIMTETKASWGEGVEVNERWESETLPSLFLSLSAPAVILFYKSAIQSALSTLTLALTHTHTHSCWEAHLCVKAICFIIMITLGSVYSNVCNVHDCVYVCVWVCVQVHSHFLTLITFPWFDGLNKNRNNVVAVQ